MFDAWLPKNVNPMDILDKLQIPYIPFWSFGEGLPVVSERSSDTENIGAAYDFLARLLFFDLKWEEIEKETAPDESIKTQHREAYADPA